MFTLIIHREHVEWGWCAHISRIRLPIDAPLPKQGDRKGRLYLGTNTRPCIVAR